MNQEIVRHLTELRKRLAYIAVGILIIFLPLFRYANDLYNLLAKPILSIAQLHAKLIAIDVTAPFFIPIKLAFICSIIISLPNTLYQIWQFLAPAMYKHEKLWLVITALVSVVMFSLGILFCYFVILPAFFKFIGNFRSPIIEVMTDITKYLDFVLNLFLIFGVAFETPVIVLLLIYFGLISYDKLVKIRPYIFIGAFVVAAILTPPDIMSQIMFAIPLYILYELGIFFARIVRRKEQL